MIGGGISSSGLNNRLINSRLHFPFDVLPWTCGENVTEYVTKENRFFDMQDPRSHAFIFCLDSVSAVVTMKFSEGDGPIDIEQVREVDRDIRPVKRLFHKDTLTLSDLAKEMVSPRN